jgi:hypothetical protein
VFATSIGLGLGGPSPVRHGGDEVRQAEDGSLGAWRPSRGLRGPDEADGQNGMEQHRADYGNADDIIRKAPEPMAAVEG